MKCDHRSVQWSVTKSVKIKTFYEADQRLIKLPIREACGFQSKETFYHWKREKSVIALEAESFWHVKTLERLLTEPNLTWMHVRRSNNQRDIKSVHLKQTAAVQRSKYSKRDLEPIWVLWSFIWRESKTDRWQKCQWKGNISLNYDPL